MIEFRNVTKKFRDPKGEEVTAVTQLDLVIPDGETHCLIGTSGCGKTTCLRMVNRLEEPTEGMVQVDGTPVRDQDPIALRRRIGYVIQTGGLFPHMTVVQNIGLLCELEGWEPSRVRARVDELLSLVNLPSADYADRYPGELSGGQQQRVGVARALAMDPAYVLMDEPFGALDPITRSQLHEEFRQLLLKVQKTVLMVTHDLHEAFLLADRVSIMDQGQVIQTGSAEELRTQPATEFVAEFLSAHSAGGGR